MTVGELTVILERYAPDVELFWEDGSHVMDLRGMTDPSRCRLAFCSRPPKTKYRPLEGEENEGA